MQQPYLIWSSIVAYKIETSLTNKFHLYTVVPHPYNSTGLQRLQCERKITSPLGGNKSDGIQSNLEGTEWSYTHIHTHKGLNTSTENGLMMAPPTSPNSPE